MSIIYKLIYNNGNKILRTNFKINNFCYTVVIDMILLKKKTKTKLYYLLFFQEGFNKFYFSSQQYLYFSLLKISMF